MSILSNKWLRYVINIGPYFLLLRKHLFQLLENVDALCFVLESICRLFHHVDFFAPFSGSVLDKIVNEESSSHSPELVIVFFSRRALWLLFKIEVVLTGTCWMKKLGFKLFETLVRANWMTALIKSFCSRLFGCFFCPKSSQEID